MHFSETDNPVIPARAHFAVEVDNWDEMLAHLDALGVAYSRTGSGASSSGEYTSEEGHPETSFKA